MIRLYLKYTENFYTFFLLINQFLTRQQRQNNSSQLKPVHELFLVQD